MYNKLIISIKITFFIVVFFTIFSVISIFLFSPTSSIKEFTKQLFNTKIDLNNHFFLWISGDKYKLLIDWKPSYWNYTTISKDNTHISYLLDNNDRVEIYNDGLINYYKEGTIYKTSNLFKDKYVSLKDYNITFSHNGNSFYQLILDDKIYDWTLEFKKWFKSDIEAKVFVLNWEKDILDKKYLVEYSDWKIELLWYDFSLIGELIKLEKYYDLEIYDLNKVDFYNFILIKSFSIWLGIFLVIFYFIFSYFWKIEKLNKKLVDYNHFLAHEIKTPISVIHSNLEVLKYWFDTEIIKKSQQELKNITNIVDSLLHFAESLKITELKTINLENFIKNYISWLKLNWKNINIYNKEFNYIIKTDEILFWRVLKNLIENALKYTFSQDIDIEIKSWSLIISNDIETTLSTYDINKIYYKFYSKSSNNSYWIWIPLIKEILKNLWFWFEIYSSNNKFFAKIIFNNSNNDDYKLQ